MTFFYKDISLVIQLTNSLKKLLKFSFLQRFKNTEKYSVLNGKKFTSYLNLPTCSTPGELFNTVLPHVCTTYHCAVLSI